MRGNAGQAKSSLTAGGALRIASTACIGSNKRFRPIISTIAVAPRRGVRRSIVRYTSLTQRGAGTAGRTGFLAAVAPYGRVPGGTPTHIRVESGVEDAGGGAAATHQQHTAIAGGGTTLWAARTCRVCSLRDLWGKEAGAQVRVYCCRGIGRSGAGGG